MQSKTTGFVGLGNMGAGMARNLLGKVDSLYVYDLEAQAAQALVSAGALPSDSIMSIVSSCDVVFLCLPDAEQVRSSLLKSGVLTSAKTRPGLIIDTTTMGRDDAIAIGREVSDLGVGYCDCPVSGLPKRAHDGTLKLMFGGERSWFDQNTPLLSAFGEAIYCGDLGMGQAMKAINNIIYNINIAALCEVLPLAMSVGLKPELLEEIVLSGSSRSFASEHFVPRMLDGHFSDDFSMQAAYKDISNIKNMAAESGASIPVVKAMIATYDAAIACGYGSEPKSAMLKVYEEALGIRFRRSS